ncbi:MAG: enoyl-CoA hydratase/isomerase family protein [Polyangiales bacterium]
MLRISGDELCEVWTVERPESANALDRATSDALSRALDDLEKRVARGTGPRGLVIASAARASGQRPVFLSGADLRELKAIAHDTEARHFAARMIAFLRQVEALPILVVAAISGDVYGGGCELVTACDIRVSERTAQFSFKQTRMGLTTGWGGTTRLVHLVGLGAAKRLLLTGLPCDAEEALRIGLVDELVDGGKSLDRARELVTIASEGGPEALASLKRGLHDAVVLDAEESYARELDRFVEAWSSAEHQEALAALDAKRPPRFR